MSMEPWETRAAKQDALNRERLIKENIASMEAVRQLAWGKTLFTWRLCYEEGILCNVSKPRETKKRSAVVPTKKGKTRAVYSKA